MASTNASSGSSMNGPNAEAPALLTRTSTPPRRSAACATKPSQPARLRRSAGIGTTSIPVAFAMSAAVAFSVASVRAQIATRTPSSASLRATAAPMPSLAPVTSAVLPRRPSSMLERANQLRGPRARVDALVPFLDLAVRTDHHPHALGPLRGVWIRAVGGPDLPVRVADEREVERELLRELLVVVLAVERRAQDRCVLPVVLGFEVAEPAPLCRSARCVGLGIEPEHDHLAL